MILALLLSLSLNAGASCTTTRPKGVAGTQVYMMDMGDQCLVSVDPRNSPGLIYRSYGIFSDGLLMVFNSFGDGDDISRLTAAREFYFFPRSAPISFTVDEQAQTLFVTLPNGDRLHFDTATGQAARLDRGAVTVAANVEPANRGGMEIPSYNGLLLDAGFSMGRAPTDRPKAESTFRDAQGQRCAVRNEEIFEYTPDGEHHLKHTDLELANFLRFRCPFLNPGFPSPTDPIRTQPTKAFPRALQLRFGR